MRPRDYATDDDGDAPLLDAGSLDRLVDHLAASHELDAAFSDHAEEEDDEWPEAPRRRKSRHRR